MAIREVRIISERNFNRVITGQLYSIHILRVLVDISFERLSFKIKVKLVRKLNLATLQVRITSEYTGVFVQ